MAKKRLLWAVWLTVCTLLYIFENGLATRTILLSVVFVPILWGGAARLLAKRLTCKMQLVPLEDGQGLRCRVELNLWLPLDAGGRLLIKNTLTGQEAACDIAMGGFGRVTAEVDVDSRHCGHIEGFFDDIHLSDPFGLWPVSAGCTCGDAADIIPQVPDIRVHIMSAVGLSAGEERYSETRSGNDPGEIFGVDEYALGDPIRQIHWKLSEKTDRIMVRRLGLPVSEGILLLFETAHGDDRPSPDEIDTMSRLFLGISAGLAYEGIAHEVGWAGGELRKYMRLYEIASADDFAQMQRGLMTASFDFDNESVTSAFLRQRGGTYSHTVVVGHRYMPQSPMPGGRTSLFLVSDSGGAEYEGIYTTPVSTGACPEDIEI